MENPPLLKPHSPIEHRIVQCDVYAFVGLTTATTIRHLTTIDDNTPLTLVTSFDTAYVNNINDNTEISVSFKEVHIASVINLVICLFFSCVSFWSTEIHIVKDIHRCLRTHIHQISYLDDQTISEIYKDQLFIKINLMLSEDIS